MCYLVAIQSGLRPTRLRNSHINKRIQLTNNNNNNYYYYYISIIGRS